MKKFLSMLLVFVLAFVLVGCGEEEKDETIRIASVGPTSGEVAVYGNTTKQGIELAIKEINAAGGIKVGDKEMQIEWLDMIDDGASADKAATAFNTQYAKGIDLMLGAVTSGATEGLIGQAMGREVIVLTPTGTADLLTNGVNGDERELRANVFRACFNDSYQGEIAAKFLANNLNKKKVAILVNQTESYSVGLTSAFKATAAKVGIEVAYEGTYQSGDSDFNALWNNVKSSGAEAVFVPDYYEKVVAIATQGRAAGYEGAMVGADGWDGILGVEGVDATVFNNTYFTNHFAADSTEETVKNFVEKFKAEYNEAPSSFATLGYDAVYLYKAAIEKANSKAYADVLAVLNSADFQVSAVTGNIKFNNGNAVKAAVVMEVKNGAYKYFATIE